MSFNKSLWFATGAQIGKEARALMNAGTAFSSFWARKSSEPTALHDMSLSMV
jgi:hypothetical protein